MDVLNPTSILNTMYCQMFLDKLVAQGMIVSKGRALDCGRGLISDDRMSDVLCNLFDHVDLLDEDEGHLETTKSNMMGLDIVDKFYCSGLPDFQPDDNVKYDLICIDSCFLGKTDKFVVDSLKNFRELLNTHGIIVVREVTCLRPNDVLLINGNHVQSATIFRDIKKYSMLFLKANLLDMATKKQTFYPPCYDERMRQLGIDGFWGDHFRRNMFALRKIHVK